MKVHECPMVENTAFLHLSDSGTPEDMEQRLRCLLFRYGQTPCPQIAGKIACCLDSILSNGQLRVSGEERCVYRQMRTFWRLIARQG